MSAGFTFPWEQGAMGGEELPEGLSLPDQMAYTALRNIYAAYHRKILDRETAAAEKKRIRREYDRAVDRLAFEDKLAWNRARVLRDTETAKTACRKDPTPENALGLCDVIDGISKVTCNNGGERYEGEDSD